MPLPFDQPTTDVTSSEGLRRAVDRLGDARELAVDVEADAMHAFRARLCFVQIGTDASLFLLDTLVPEVRPETLAPLFGDAGRTKFFHAAGGDLQYLAEAGVRVQGLFDTHRAATLLGWPKVGLADLARDLLQVELPKDHQQSDFSIRPLPSGIHDYIANDVRYLCDIGRRVREACRTADILEEVLLDCQRLADEAAARPEVGADFRPKLPRGELGAVRYALGSAIAYALNERRVAWAREEDVPIGRMLSNAAITALATAPPATLQALKKTMGVRGPFVREHGEQVLDLIQALVARSQRGELEPPRDERGARDPSRRNLAEALKDLRAKKAVERKVTPSVVLPNPLVDQLLDDRPASLDALARVPYFGPKRLGLYGEDVIALVRRHSE